MNKDNPQKPGAPGFILEPEEAASETPVHVLIDPPPPVSTGPGWFSRFFALVGIVIVGGLILAFFAFLKFSVLFLPPQEVSREVVVSIPEGATPAQIGQILEEAGVVKSGTAFYWAFRVINKFKGPVVLKAGEMALDPSLPVWKTLTWVADGKHYKLYPFTVAEGKNIYDIAQMVAAAGFGSQDDFLTLCRDPSFITSLGLEAKSLEGYLFPETYNFPRGTPLKTIMKTMVDTFVNVWQKGNYDEAARRLGLSRHQVVILASIVEKETGAPRERPIIAGVFFNRLAKGMRLQTDPTVIYGLLPNFDGNITRNDLATPHPYNTYVIAGLPPGPIANPGAAALSAVLKPDFVPFYYFVSKNDGTHDFSENLADHNRKVTKYQRLNRNAQAGRSRRP